MSAGFKTDPNIFKIGMQFLKMGNSKFIEMHFPEAISQIILNHDTHYFMLSPLCAPESSIYVSTKAEDNSTLLAKRNVDQDDDEKPCFKISPINIGAEIYFQLSPVHNLSAKVYVDGVETKSLVKCSEKLGAADLLKSSFKFAPRFDGMCIQMSPAVDPKLSVYAVNWGNSEIKVYPNHQDL